MTGFRAYIPALILFVLAIVFQGAFANAITIGSATPNFFVAFALVIAAVYPRPASVIMGFVLGLLYNLLVSGTVGSMALVLTLLTALVVMVFSRMDGTSLIFALVSLFILGFLAEVLYGVLTGVFVSGISVSEAMIHRALPCGVYDALITCVLYPLPALVENIMSNRQSGQGEWKL